MQGQRIADLRRALNNLTGLDRSLTGQFARFRNRETVIMLPFDHQPKQATRFDIRETGTDSGQMQAMRSYIGGLAVDGGTAIYDALLKALELAAGGRGEDPGRFYSIVLLTDGDNQQGMEFDEFERRYRAMGGGGAGVPVFPILFGDSNVAEMEGLGRLTGGRTFDANKHSLALVFKQIRGYQ
jgi:Ca-activated chloride channel family protein